MVMRRRETASAGTDFATPCAEKITGAPVSGTSSSSCTKIAPFAAEALDHVFVVDDLVAHIDRRAVADERLLDGIDGPHHPGAEAARGAEQDVEGG